MEVDKLSMVMERKYSKGAQGHGLHEVGLVSFLCSTRYIKNEDSGDDVNFAWPTQCVGHAKTTSSPEVVGFLVSVLSSEGLRSGRRIRTTTKALFLI